VAPDDDSCLAAFTPINYTFLNGQLSAILLLVFIGGCATSRQFRFVAGVYCRFGAEAQIRVGPFLWMLMRRDFRTGGYCLGGLVQAAWSAVMLGPNIIFD